MKDVYIRLLGGCSVITAEGGQQDFLAAKSRKGVSLMEYLILQRGKPVSAQRLIREMWSGKRNDNPENALKTMVSRLRALLNGVSPGLGGCIECSPGGYGWRSAPGVQVDVLEMLRLLEEAGREASDQARGRLYERAVALYEGDLFHTGDIFSGAMLVNWLHREYLNAVYAYIELLKRAEAYNEICRVCARAIRIDDLDEHLRIEMMRALVRLNRLSDAAREYRRITCLTRVCLDADPSESMQREYRRLAEEGRTLNFNLDRIRNELTEKEGERIGPFFCDYSVFREIYNIQMRNLERLGSSVFLGVFLVGDPGGEDGRQEEAMEGLTEILRRNLRKGDIVTRFSANILAVLLPTLNYATGSVVTERIEHLFYETYAGRGVNLHARISLLGGAAAQEGLIRAEM